MPSDVVRVLSPSALHSSLEAIVVAYRGAGGSEVVLTFEPAPRLAERIAKGEIADVVIAPPAVMAQLQAAGKANPEGCFTVGRVGVGVAARQNAPLPDISSTETLKKALLEAD